MEIPADRTPAGRRPAILAAALAAAFVCTGFDEGSLQFYIPYVPTPQPVVDRMLELGAVGEDDFVIDLGSGDGRIVISAARDRGARGLGVDIEPRLVRMAKENAAKDGVADRVEFLEQDLFDTPIAHATVITLYLPPAINLQLRPRLLTELRPGTRVVSHAFDMGRWQPEHRERYAGAELFLWIVPARVAGRWDLRGGERQMELDLHQEFQTLVGTAMVDGQMLPVRDGRLHGNEIRFLLDIEGAAVEFRGAVTEDRMTGITAAEAAGTWQATRRP